MTLEQFAAGVLQVVNANMERALRLVSIERGYDPRDFALVAFGGAGGLHACDLAEALLIPTVIMPANPGALSAYGILVSDPVKDFSRTVLWNLAGGKHRAALDKEFQKLESAARKELQSERWIGAPFLERSLDLRYRGQGYELNIPAVGNAVTRFHQEHQRRYGYHHPKKEIELVTVRLRARIKAVKATIQRRRTASHQTTTSGRAKVVFQGKEIATPVYERKHLTHEESLTGPAIVTEYSATTVIPPGKKFRVDEAENLLITVGQPKRYDRHRR
jgi:N-methylhydantoinase A